MRLSRTLDGSEGKRRGEREREREGGEEGGREGERERKAEAAMRHLGFRAKRTRRAQGRFGMVAYGLCQHLSRILGFAARQIECTLGERRLVSPPVFFESRPGRPSSPLLSWEEQERSRVL